MPAMADIWTALLLASHDPSIRRLAVEAAAALAVKDKATDHGSRLANAARVMQRLAAEAATALAVKHMCLRSSPSTGRA